MSRAIISTKDAPGAVGPYSQAIACDGWLYVSGQIPLNPATGEMVEGDIQAKTRQVLTNLEAILQEAGAGFGDVVKVNVYILDMAEFDPVNRVYAEFFKEDPPARACVAVRSLPKGADVEIDLVARIS
jgi:2-iminobutanoate/2-iminopropanoate deaminase